MSFHAEAPLRVLITAGGGDVSQAILKALRLAPEVDFIVGVDAVPMPHALVFFDAFATVPPARDGAYIEVLDDVCRRYRIDVCVPASESEIAAVAALETLPCGSCVLTLGTHYVRTYGDKLACMRALEGLVPLAPFADGDDLTALEEITERAGFPLVVKARVSAGSKSLRIVSDKRGLQEATEATASPLVQAFIEGPEFSIGVFAWNGDVRVSAFERRLGMGGLSVIAQTSNDCAVVAYARKIAVVSALRGSANVQVRKGRDGVRLLEINTRLSSLTGARAVSGFGDARWWVLAACGHVPPREDPVMPLHFARYVGELVDRGDGYMPVTAWLPRVHRQIKSDGLSSQTPDISGLTVQ